MRIDKINIENFRCFKSYEVSFAEKTTVLIGKNGTGKTNLISAVKKGLSFIFSKNNPEKFTSDVKDGGKISIPLARLQKLKPFSVSSDLHISKFEQMDANYDSHTRVFSYPIKINYSGILDSQQIEWTFVKKSYNGGILSIPFLNAFIIFLEYVNKIIPKSPLPILAFFSDSYPHNKINIGKYAKSILNMTGPLPIDFGYYQWDTETNCAEIWQKRYIKIYNKINDVKNPYLEKTRKAAALYTVIQKAPLHPDIEEWKNQLNRLNDEISHLEKESSDLKEINFIDSRIIRFTKVLREDLDFINKEFEINEIIVDRPIESDNHQMQFVFANDCAIYFDALPQGYKRLLSIVFDIAYRSYILNEGEETAGIVFIDEIELHLHPTLQQEVLERFRTTFPQIQFIVSTHSPLVITNLKADGKENKIIKLINDGMNYSNEQIENIYGIDYTTGLQIMDSAYRPSTIDNLIDTYVILKLRNKDELARNIWGDLFGIVGRGNKNIENEIKEKLEANK